MPKAQVQQGDLNLSSSLPPSFSPYGGNSGDPRCGGGNNQSSALGSDASDSSNPKDISRSARVPGNTSGRDSAEWDISNIARAIFSYVRKIKLELYCHP